MTGQELFESSLQTQADYFDWLKEQFKQLMALYPLHELAQTLSLDPNNIQEAEMIMNQWIEDNFLSKVIEGLHMSADQALETIAAWIKAMGLGQ